MDIGQCGSTPPSAEPPHPSSCPTTQSASLRLVPVNTNSKPEAWKGRRFQRALTTCVLGDGVLPVFTTTLEIYGRRNSLVVVGVVLWHTLESPESA